MSNAYFRFKQFTIYHNLCAMKVSIDGVLLGAWASTEKAEQILDIGTGSGLIALMLAQRNPQAKITAIDIDNDAVLQTKTNVENSPWKNRINTLHTSLQKFAKNDLQFDFIVSNPPYFINSLKAPDEQRSSARHTEMLTHEELIVHSKKLLSPNGKICIILPLNEGRLCIESAKANGLFCTKEVKVFPKPNTEVKRLLLEFSSQEAIRTTSELTIETENRHQYSPEFIQLAKEFYLKL